MRWTKTDWRRDLLGATQGRSTLVVAFVAGLLLLGGMGMGAAQRRDTPQTPPWTSTLTNDFGSDTARSGMEGARFVQNTNRPVVLANVLRGFPGMRFQGEADIRGLERNASRRVMTMTAAIDDVSPVSIWFTSTCYYEPPVGASAHISGTVRRAGCALDRSGCAVTGTLDYMDGIPCPAWP